MQAQVARNDRALFLSPFAAMFAFTASAFLTLATRSEWSIPTVLFWSLLGAFIYSIAWFVCGWALAWLAWRFGWFRSMGRSLRIGAVGVFLGLFMLAVAIRFDNQFWMILLGTCLNLAVYLHLQYSTPEGASA